MHVASDVAIRDGNHRDQSLFSDRRFAIAEPTEDALRFGRKEIELARYEMPGLTALHEEFAERQPLKGARITGSLHMTVQTAVLMETLVALGAELRWASCNILSTQDHAATAIAIGPTGTLDNPAGIPIFAWRCETLEEYWWCTLQSLCWPDHDGPNLLLDDGGDATDLVHRGFELERDDVMPDPNDSDVPILQAMLTLLRDVRRAQGNRFWHRMIAGIRGVSEETTTGIHRLNRRAQDQTLRFPAINVNDSVTKSQFDNVYGCRQSLIDGLMRATDVLIGGKRALVIGYGHVGKGSVEALQGQGARVCVAEADPICALQACMRGIEVTRVEDVVREVDIFVTATGNRNVITPQHMREMRHNAIVCNIGHFDAEIDMLGLEQMRERGEVERIEIKPLVHEWRFTNTTHGPHGGGHSILVLAEGRLVNLGCATGHPSLVMSTSFTNQVLAQIELHHKAADNTAVVTRLSKILDEKVARLHLDRFGAKLTVLRPDQAHYISVPIAGPFKSGHYRY